MLDRRLQMSVFNDVLGSHCLPGASQQYLLQTSFYPEKVRRPQVKSAQTYVTGAAGNTGLTQLSATSHRARMWEGASWRGSASAAACRTLVASTRQAGFSRAFTPVCWYRAADAAAWVRGAALRSDKDKRHASNDSKS